MRKIAAISAACILLGCLSDTRRPVLVAQGTDKFKLEWQLAVRECLFYDSVLGKPADTPDGQPTPSGGAEDPLMGEAPPEARTCKPVVLFGYEIDERGRRASAYPVQDLEQAVLQAASLMPKGYARAGTKWEETWQFDGWRSLTPPGLESSYELEEFANLEDHGLCARIHATHMLARAEAGFAPKRWESLKVTTDSWFSIEGHYLARSEATVLGLTNVQKNEAKPPVNDRLTWVMAGRCDSMETASLIRRSEDALLRGVEYLWSKRTKEGTWNPWFRPRGGTSLALVTLLSCGMRADDPRVIEGFRGLAELKLERTYEAAVSCMAYEALLVRRRADTGDETAGLSREEARELTRVSNWLLDARNSSNECWNYLPATPDGGRWFSMSILEWAVRGLAAAQRCGVPLPITMVKRICEEVLSFQAADGDPIRRVTSGEYRKNSVKVSRASRPTPARGWTYDRKVGTGGDKNAAKAYGSMTCAGINSLAGLLEVAQNASKAERGEVFGKDGFKPWKQQIMDAVEGGLAWLEQNYMITRNPGEGYAIDNQGQYFCYLHGLERCCTFSETDWLGEHNWYDEGRAALLLTQNKDGSWVRHSMDGADTVEDTCFAVLFLKKSILKPHWPVFTQKESE